MITKQELESKLKALAIGERLVVDNTLEYVKIGKNRVSVSKWAYANGDSTFPIWVWSHNREIEQEKNNES